MFSSQTHRLFKLSFIESVGVGRVGARVVLWGQGRKMSTPMQVSSMLFVLPLISLRRMLSYLYSDWCCNRCCLYVYC